MEKEGTRAQERREIYKAKSEPTKKCREDYCTMTIEVRPTSDNLITPKD